MEGGEGIGDCHAPLRGARNDRGVVCHCEEPVFWATWQSLVAKVNEGVQKRDCFGATKQAPRNEKEGESENWLSQIATAPSGASQ